MTVTLAVAALALVIAVAAAALAVVVMRQNADTTTELRDHRRAHTIAHGHPDPKLDRRQVNLGPPRTGERRGQRFDPPADRYAPRPPDPHQLTRHHLDDPTAPPPGYVIADDDTDTSELDRTDPPTTAMPAAQRPRPRQDQQP